MHKLSPSEVPEDLHLSGWTLQEVKLLIWTVAFLLEYLGF